MISSPLPRWPDRDAAGPGATFPLTVRCAEQPDGAVPFKVPLMLVMDSDGRMQHWTDPGDGVLRPSMTIWPDEVVDKPATTRSWWPIIGVTLFAAGNAAIWIIGMASLVRRIIEPGAPFP